MAAEQNLITTDEMRKVREVDFVSQFAHNSLAKLLEVLGVTRKIPMMEGTTMYVYSTTGTLHSGAVDEGDIIPLSQYETRCLTWWINQISPDVLIDHHTSSGNLATETKAAIRLVSPV